MEKGVIGMKAMKNNGGPKKPVEKNLGTKTKQAKGKPGKIKAKKAY